MLINPKLPKHFFDRDNAKRSQTEIKKYWGNPIILSKDGFFSVYCLDGGAWDRPTLWGGFNTLEDAMKCCENGPSYL